MLKTRIIPTLLWRDSGLVKGVGFDSWRNVGAVLPAIKVYNARQVDELILLDIIATKENREPDFETINDFSAECFVPLTVGGGIKNIGHVKKLLRAGADKVCINSALYENIDFLQESSNLFGKQCIVAGIDAKKVNGKYECFSLCGSKATALRPDEWAKELERNGAGEIMITSIERDGTMSGYDIELVKMVAESVSIPVIASGGAGNSNDVYKVLKEAGASAAAMASMFHFTEQTPLQIKEELSFQGVNVRKAV